MFSLADIVGFAGTVTGISFMLPQVYRTYTTKSVEDLSWGMLILIFLNCVFWFTYGVLLHALPLIAVNGIGGLVISVQIFLKILYRNNP